ncbi:MAG: Thiazole biosynthesis protein ThiG [Candidatus Carbobacillus altaicus]|uniref:Thiazole synthase n=1 Tax=Candidatus Carbonibacillus altaicus TaxID=2163959 RepID=A0A2R6Y0M5_9BACL|nr:MAG: Thiazole biosynthesis protein ThiG [Candidatus Carbobacillus altaicus]
MYDDDLLHIGPYIFRSRLFLGTGKYPDESTERAAIEASGAEVLTFALRRLPLADLGIESANASSILAHIDRTRHRLLPNTAGARTAEEAVRLARLARSSGLTDMIKVEIVSDDELLWPEPLETLKATEILVREGMIVLAYTSDDVALAKRLEEVGAHAVMPGAAPIGSGLGILNPYTIRWIKARLKVPVIVDAGLGSAADAALAMELGADAVLVNTAVAEARDPVMMAAAMKDAVHAGHTSYLAGRMPRREKAQSSSPTTNMIK